VSDGVEQDVVSGNETPRQDRYRRAASIEQNDRGNKPLCVIDEASWARKVDELCTSATKEQKASGSSHRRNSSRISAPSPFHRCACDWVMGRGVPTARQLR
jgi:hypothetical protein